MPTKSPLQARRSKLFRNGGSQAVRIPKEMKFETDEVILHREGDRLIIEPTAQTLSALSKSMGKPLDWDWEDANSPVEAENIFE